MRDPVVLLDALEDGEMVWAIFANGKGSSFLSLVTKGSTGDYIILSELRSKVGYIFLKQEDLNNIVFIYKTTKIVGILYG